jgi:hypothetical protein
MPDDDVGDRLSIVDRLELVALDLELRRATRALIEAVWESPKKERSSRCRRG